MSTPPRLLVRILWASFTCTAVILAGTSLAVYAGTKSHLTRTVASVLESSQRTFAVFERQRHAHLVAQATALAENPTLKAALDTLYAEAGDATPDASAQLTTTVERELDRLTAIADAQAIVVVDPQTRVVASVGADRHLWRHGESLAARLERGDADSDIILRKGPDVFRALAVPLTIGADPIGELFIVTQLDTAYARALTMMASTATVVTSGDRVLGHSLPPETAPSPSVLANLPTSGTTRIAAEEYAVRRLWTSGDVAIFALQSITRASVAPIRELTGAITLIAVLGLLLGAGGSFWLARTVAAPIDDVSRELSVMVATRQFGQRLPRTGTSREVDSLISSFEVLQNACVGFEQEKQAAYVGAIQALAAALDARDPYTAGHSARVSTLSVEISKEMALDAHDTEIVRLGALLHDIGKIGIADAILQKPGPLTTQEFETIRQHPELGARILRPVPFLQPYLPVVELHHERPDGRGYPLGLIGDAIPLPARIVHVADAFDAMTTARAYRSGRSVADAMAELWRGAGPEFDTPTVQALDRIVRRVARPAAADVGPWAPPAPETPVGILAFPPAPGWKQAV